VIILDTDALGHLQKNDPVGTVITGRLEASPDRDVRITAVTAYEMLSGAVALIDRRKKQRGDLVPALLLLQDLIEYLGTWRGLILPYDAASEQIYTRLPARLRQELKDDARIAAIALTHGAIVWTCNVADHMRVPGLIVVRAETGFRVP
jgi:predicted nucleic acid-binding protein